MKEHKSPESKVDNEIENGDDNEVKNFPAQKQARDGKLEAVKERNTVSFIEETEELEVEKGADVEKRGLIDLEVGGCVRDMKEDESDDAQSTIDEAIIFAAQTAEDELRTSDRAASVGDSESNKSQDDMADYTVGGAKSYSERFFDMNDDEADSIELEKIRVTDEDYILEESSEEEGEEAKNLWRDFENEESGKSCESKVEESMEVRDVQNEEDIELNDENKEIELNEENEKNNIRPNKEGEINESHEEDETEKNIEEEDSVRDEHSVSQQGGSVNFAENSNLNSAENRSLKQESPQK